MVTKHDIHVIFMQLKAICVRIGIKCIHYDYLS